MQEDRIKSYFKQQARSIVQRSTFQPDGCLAYFIGREVERGRTGPARGLLKYE